MKSKNTLYILGNGFDTAHAIKSRYSDFHDYVIRVHEDNAPINLIDYFFGSKEHQFWKDTEAALGEYDVKSIYKFCAPEGEPDLDHSLREFAVRADSTQLLFEPSLKAFKHLFAEWVESIDISQTKKFLHLSPDDYYLTFNYTDTLETVYGIPSDHVCHIHGNRLQNEDYIIGHNTAKDKTKLDQTDWPAELEAKERVIDVMNSFLKKYDDNIMRHRDFFDRLTDIDCIQTIGLSMSQIDRPYLVRLATLLGTDKKWYIACFSDKDEDNAHATIQECGLTNATVYRTANIDKVDRVFIYKRNHIGDPDKRGIFGIEGCMGCQRSGRYDAVIGIGAKYLWPKHPDIRYKVNWVGIGPRRIKIKGRKGKSHYAIVFKYFVLYEENGATIKDNYPHLYQFFYTQQGNHQGNRLRHKKYDIDDAPISDDILALLQANAYAHSSEYFDKPDDEIRRLCERNFKCDISTCKRKSK